MQNRVIQSDIQSSVHCVCILAVERIITMITEPLTCWNIFDGRLKAVQVEAFLTTVADQHSLWLFINVTKLASNVRTDRWSCILTWLSVLWLKTALFSKMARDSKS